jgi:hypothetical protein
LQNIRGEVTSVETLPGEQASKFRYLKIDNFPETFRLFVGKSAGDFKPEFEKIDSLKKEDVVTIYFSGNETYFIDRGEEAIFIKGSFQKYLSIGIIICCTILILLLVILKSKGKIT